MMEEKRDVARVCAVPPAPPRSGENFILSIPAAHLIVETSQMTDRSRKSSNLLSQTWLVGLKAKTNIVRAVQSSSKSANLQAKILKLPHVL